LVFITINLYNFIFCILNNFLKTYLKIITEGFTDRIYPSVFDSSSHSHRRIYRRIYFVGIMDSPTILPIDIILRYCTVPATMIDECTYGYLWSVFQTFTDKFTDGLNSSLCHTITDGLNPLVYFKRETFFFGVQFPSVKPLANFFFADRYSDELWYYRRKKSRRILSVRTSVNKLPMKS
jgi:hypothetical protein